MEKTNESKLLSYSYIGSLFLKYWYLIIISLGLCFALAHQELLKELPSYQVSGTVMIEEDKSAGAIEGGIRGVTLKVGNTLGNEIQMLKSRNMMEDVIRELALEINYKCLGEHKDIDLYYDSPIRLNFSDNIESLAWKDINVEILDTSSFVLTFDGQEPQNHLFGDPFILQDISFVMNRTKRPITDQYRKIQISILPKEYVAQQYANSLNLLRIESSDLIQFSIDQEVPQKGIDIINKLVEIFFRKSLDEKKKQASNTLMFIEERLKYVTDELFNVEKSMEIYKVNNNIPEGLADNAATYGARIATTNEAILDLEIKKNDLSDALTQVTSADKQYDLLLPSAGIQSQAITELIMSYNTALNKRRELLFSHEEIHPNVQKMETEIGDLRAAVTNGIRTAIQNSESRLKDLQVELVPLTRRMSDIPKNERELLQIMRQQQIKETLFLYLLEKREETAISMAAQIGNAKIIDSPTTKDKQPSSASRYYALAFILGLSLPLGLILVIEQFNDKIQSEQEIKAIPNTTFLGSICKTSQSKKIVIDQKSRSAVAEMFRLLRTNLGFSVANSANPVVMVTSPQPGDGKSFVCLNLSISLAISGKKVVMLEMDLRRPQLLEYLKEGNPNAGLTNYLVGKMSLSKIINKSDQHPNLHYISSGPIPPNPSELLIINKMELLIEQLKKQYDFIIIDTPPVGLVADALLINKFSTNSIVVLREKKTRRKDIEMIMDLCEKKKLNKPGLVLNGVRPSGKRYGGGYYAEETPSIWNRNKKLRPKLKDATV